MKRSWRGSGVGEENAVPESSASNGSLLSQDERSRDDSSRKVPRSLSFGASSSHGSNHAEVAFMQSAPDAFQSSIGSNVVQSAARPVSGAGLSPQNPAKAPIIHTGMTEQQKLAAIQEVLPAVSRKVTACAACR